MKLSFMQGTVGLCLLGLCLFELPQQSNAMFLKSIRLARLALMGLVGMLISSIPGMAEDPVDVRIYTESYPPYSYQTEGKVIDGLSTRIVRRIMDESGLSYQIQLVPWTRAYRAVLAQDNALIFTIARTPDRDALFNWLVPLGHVRFYLYARSDDSRFVADMKMVSPEFRVACLVDDVSCALVENLGLPESSIVRIAELDRPDVMLVLAGRADLYVAEEVYNLYRLKRLGVDVTRTRKVMKLDREGDLFLASALGFRPALAKAILEARERLIAKGENLSFDAESLSELPD